MQLPRMLTIAMACALALAVPTTSAIEFDDVDVPANYSNAKVEADTFGGASTTMTISATAETTDGGLDVGKTVDVNPRDYSLTTKCKAQSWTITYKSATTIALEFAQLSLPAGDSLVAVAANGVQVPVTPSTDNSETITSGVPGSTITLKYTPSATCSQLASFALTKLVVREATVQKEAVCGLANTMENAKCFADAASEEDRKMATLAKAVLRSQRVRADGRIVVCTVWLWGNKGHLVTNNHCFSSQDMVNNAQFDFGVETATCAAKCTPGSCPIARFIKGRSSVKFIASDPTLDVALMQITDPKLVASLISQFGYLQIYFGMPLVGQQIYIPQHPGGGAIQIAKTDDDNNVNIATIKSVNAKVAVEGVTFTGLIGYAADTESGSSGSPVMARDSNLVVGLHRIGFCNNAATPSKSLLGFLVPLVKGNNDGFSA